MPPLPAGDRVAGPRSGRRRRDGGIAPAAPAGQARRRVPGDSTAGRRVVARHRARLRSAPRGGPRPLQDPGEGRHRRSHGGRRVWPRWSAVPLVEPCRPPTGCSPSVDRVGRGTDGVDVVGPVGGGAGVDRCVRAAARVGRGARGAAHRGRESRASASTSTIRTIPQEAFLEVDAVSFTKGCFIGQELVCRIDSRGHVNRFLRRLSLPGTTVPPRRRRAGGATTRSSARSRARPWCPAKTASSPWPWCAARSSRPPT